LKHFEILYFQLFFIPFPYIVLNIQTLLTLSSYRVIRWKQRCSTVSKLALLGYRVWNKRTDAESTTQSINSLYRQYLIQLQAIQQQYGFVCCQLLAGYLFGLLSNPEDGSNMFLRNVFELLRTTRRYISEDSSYHSLQYETFKYNRDICNVLNG
jgi:hypothetical protein